MENQAPQGYGTICPFIVVDNVERQVAFLQAAFDANIKGVLKNADGMSVHAEIIIGNSVIMLGKGSDALASQPSMNYIYVTDADSVYKKALEFGAVSVYEPDDKFYGIREAGFKDLSNNTWFIAQHLKDVSAEEIEKVFAERK